MPQLATSAQARKIYHQTFEIKSNGVSQLKHTLLINPSDISIEEPNRATVTQTLGGAYLALFGQGLHSVTISGTTGYNARFKSTGELTDGYQEIKALRKNVYRNFITKYDPQYEMFWYDWENGEFYKIMPMNFALQRSVQEPNMYRYTIQFTTLQELGAQTKPTPDNRLALVNALIRGRKLGESTSALSEIMTLLKG